MGRDAVAGGGTGGVMRNLDICNGFFGKADDREGRAAHAPGEIRVGKTPCYCLDGIMHRNVVNPVGIIRLRT